MDVGCPGRRSPRRGGERAGHDALGVVRGEERGNGERARDDTDEVVHRLLTALDRTQELLHLRRGRLEPRKVQGELEQGGEGGVAPPR